MTRIQDALADSGVLEPGGGITISQAAPGDPVVITSTGAYTDEMARDAIAAAMVAGTNVTITPDDAGDTITIAATGTTDPEVVRDTIAAALVAGANVTITPNDGADTITVAASQDKAEVLIFALGDETTTITTGTAKITFRMPWAFTVTDVRASVNTVSSSGLVTVDINEAGTTILSTKLSIDASEKTSTTAATPAVISDASIADDAEMTIDIDAAGTGAKGLKVALYGVRA